MLISTGLWSAQAARAPSDPELCGISLVYPFLVLFIRLYLRAAMSVDTATNALTRCCKLTHLVTCHATSLLNRATFLRAMLP